MKQLHGELFNLAKALAAQRVRSKLYPVRYPNDWPWWQRLAPLSLREPYPMAYPGAFRRSCRDPVAQSRRGLRSGVERRRATRPRDEEVLRLSGSRFWTIRDIAAKVGLSVRQVFRVLKRMRREALILAHHFARRRQQKRLQEHLESEGDTNPLYRPPTAKMYRRPPAPPPSGQARSARFAALWRLRDEAAARQTE